MSNYCLYRMFDINGDLLYIGQSVRVTDRIRQHARTKHWWSSVRTITIEQYESAPALNIAEREAIKNEKPIHNIIFNSKSNMNRHFQDDNLANQIEMLRRYPKRFCEPISIKNVAEDWDHYADAIFTHHAYIELRKALAHFYDFLLDKYLDYFIEQNSDGEKELLGVVTSLVMALREPLFCSQCGGYGYPHQSIPREDYTYRRWSCECGATAKDNGVEFYGTMLDESRERPVLTDEDKAFLDKWISFDPLMKQFYERNT